MARQLQFCKNQNKLTFKYFKLTTRKIYGIFQKDIFTREKREAGHWPSEDQNRSDELPVEYIWLMEDRNEKPERVVCDYVSAMTDRYAIAKYNELFVPDSWHG